jgi:hypothetical protein
VPSLEDIFDDPQLLAGMTPQEVEAIVLATPNWSMERLRRGSKAGRGYVFREYGPNGEPTDRLIQWHPGGGHHGPDPYWKVSSGQGGIVRVGPQFP